MRQPADLPNAEADDPPQQLQGHRQHAGALQPPHVAADQHRADPTPLTANQFSVDARGARLLSAWLFSLGHYWPGLLGGFLSLAASVLDGCDGEIARLKYQESALGCWIETFGDYSYYIAIFVGLTVGAVRRTGWEAFYWLGAVALAGLLARFVLLIYLRSRITAGQPDKLHSIASERFKAEPTWWTAIIWRISFVATRSAMPYGIWRSSLAAPAAARGRPRGDRRQHLLDLAGAEAAAPARETTPRLSRLDRQSSRAAFHGLAHGDFVGVFEVAADRHAHRDARHADA